MAIHILISANEAWNIFNFRRGMVKHFIEQGHKVTVLAPFDDCSVKLEKLGCVVVDIPIESQGVNPFGDIVLFLRLLKQYRISAPDIVMNYTIKPNIYGSLAAGLMSIPSIAITTGLGYTFLNDSYIAKLARWLYKFAFKFPQQVWFLNSDDRGTFLLHRLVAESSTFVLNGEGVDVDTFAPRPHNQDGNIRFLLIARMLWDKGIKEYVEAARLVKERHPNVVFQLLGAAGTQNPTAISQEVVSGWHQSGVVEYLGTTGDVRPFIADSDCVVLPSYREGVPRTLMEAAAMAKPIIATDVPGCRSVVDDGINGYLCKPYDAHDLALKMERIVLATSDARARMGSCGRIKAMREFDEKIVIDKYVEKIGNILGAEAEMLSPVS